MKFISLEEMKARESQPSPEEGRFISLEEMNEREGIAALPAPREGSYVSPSGAAYVPPVSGKRKPKPVEQPAQVAFPPSDQPEMRAYEPSIWERIGDLIPQNRAAAANEYAARKIAQERKIPIDEAYRQMKESVGVKGLLGSRQLLSGQPIWNPEGRSPIPTAVPTAAYLSEAILDVPKEAIGAALKQYRAGDIAKPYDSSFIDKAISYLGDEANEIFIPNLTKKLGLDPNDKNYEQISGLAKSLGTSLISIVPQAVAGAAVATATANPIAGVGAGMATGAATAYRGSVDDFMVNVRDKLNEQSMKAFGRPMDEKEWNAAKEKYKNLAREYGAWEAVPEALGNAIFLKAFAAPLKEASKPLLKKFVERVVAVGAENITETITGLGQNSVELRAGLTKDELTVADAFKQQFIQTMLTTGLMAGGAKAIQYGNKFYETEVLPRINPDSALAKAIKADIDQIALKQAAPLRTLDKINADKEKPVTKQLSAKPQVKQAPQSTPVAQAQPEDAEDEAAPQGMPTDDEIEQDIQDETRLTPVSLEKQTPAAAALPVTPAVAPIAGKLPSDPPPGNLEVRGLPTQEIPLDSLKLSKDVPQFKLGATSEGVVEPLGGKFERTGVAPIQVWQRNDGTLEVISGRHRFDLAKRSGEETIPAQIHYESQGFDKTQAAILDAELNIRDGQGKAKDYVNYFKESGIDRNTADARGLLARATGKRSYTIATQGSDELITAIRNDQVGDEAAYYIALNAPNNASLQGVGIKAIQEGKSANTATNIMQAVKALGGGRDTTQDMFGFDDSAMQEAVEMATIASRKQREIQTRLSAISGAAKNPAVAKAEGIDIRDPNAIQKRIEELKQLKSGWDNWSTNPQLIDEIRAERGVPAPELAPVEEPVAVEPAGPSLFDEPDVTEESLLKTQTAEELRQKADREEAEAKRKQEEEKAADRKAAADKAANQFVLTGSDSPADIAIAHGQQELVPIDDAKTEENVGAVELPKIITDALDRQVSNRKARISRLKNDMDKAASHEEKAELKESIDNHERVLRGLRAQYFKAEDAAEEAIKTKDAAAFDKFAELFPLAYQAIKEHLRTDGETDAAGTFLMRLAERLVNSSAATITTDEMMVDSRKVLVTRRIFEGKLDRHGMDAVRSKIGKATDITLINTETRNLNISLTGKYVGEGSMVRVADTQYEAEEQPQGADDESSKLGTSGKGELEGAQPKTVPKPSKGKETGTGTAGSGGDDVSGGGGTGGQRGKTTGRMGDDKGKVSSDKTGANKGRGDGDGTGADEGSDATTNGTIEDAQSGGDPSLVPTSGTRSQDRSDDFIISDEDQIGVGGAKTKYKQNIAAIRLLKQLNEEGRQATREEQAVLAKYVGWGGIPQAFYRDNNEVTKGWEKEAAELKELLTPEELEAASASTRNAHYTSTEIVSAMWDAVRQFGFQGGRVLEPSVGVGNFFGMMPTDLRKASQLTGVELDHITGGIAKQLYPQANIAAPVGFQDFSAPDNYFELAIGNPPFGQESIYDKTRRNISGFSIHNYFFAKSLDTVQPNGVLAMVVTNRLLDSRGDKARSYIADRAEFIGAIRLPNDAFAKNAGTQVTTDIIFLRKLKDGERPSNKSWMDVKQYKDKNGNTVLLNEYFIRNPEMMLGEFGQYGSMYSPEDAALVAREGQDTLALLKDAIKKLPSKFMDAPTTVSKVETVEPMHHVSNVKIGSMFEQDGKIFVRKPDLLNKPQALPVEFTSVTAEKRVRGMIGVRDAFLDVRRKQLEEGVDEKELQKARKQLNKTYDAFVEQHGLINTDANKRLMRDDPTWPQMSALEEGYDKGVSAAVAKKTGDTARPPSAKKADIFSKRTQSPYKRPDTASTAKDAMLTSLAEYGRIDLDYMSAIYGKPQSTLIEELGGMMYLNPQGGWESKDQYLSGNVKKKLAQAIEAAKTDPKMKANVEALKAVQPADVEAIDIDVKIGAPWVPVDVMEDFVRQITGSQEPLVIYSPTNATWSIAAKNMPTSAQTRWGTDKVSVSNVLTAAANQRQMVVTTELPDGTRTRDVAASAAANDKVNEVKEEWKNWVWADDNRRIRLHRIYNDTFNTDVQQEFDGSLLKLPGKVGNDVLKLYPHQLNFVWRGLQTDVVLADHVVGAGKTFSLIALAMEMRRTGRAKKPMLVVPNHLVGQWSADFVKLYPNANILSTTKNDFSADNRKKLFARIATGDWDAVVVAHSSFGKVQVSPEIEAEFIKSQIDDYSKSIEATRNLEGKKSRNIKQIQKQKAALEEKLKKLLDTGAKDDNLTFEELGVDALFVDEFHEFKNLGYATGMQVGGLGDPSGSKKASDMFIKIQSILKRTGGKNIVVATGTPISNTMAEMYNMQRYLDYKTLKDQGIAHFDAWAKTFGEVVTDWELSPSGQYKMSNRFSKFVNMPELMMRYQSFADVINRDDINKLLASSGKTLPIPKIKGGKPENVIVNRSPEQAEYIGVPRVDAKGVETYPETSLIWRSEHLPKKAEKGADNMLKIMSDARKAALDMRLINPNIGDNPLSKVKVAAEKILHIYKKWNKDKGTQLVFCDLSTPKSAVAKEKAELQKLVALAEEGDTDAQEKLDNMSPDDLLALESEFSVYDDLKVKLVALGIPENEIAFIHDANTDIRKEELFAKVRTGMVRVLVGSTGKMGAGMNVQERLVALHHLDAPWKPSDLEQREGRIIRQGNKLYEKDPQGFEIEILRYASKQTLDSRMWQTLETKARFIEQVRKGTGERQVEDIGSEAANSAEMKAASSGNPLILEEMTLRKKVRDLETQRYNHERSQHRIKNEIRAGEERNKFLETKAAAMEQDANLVPKEFAVTINGKTYKKHSEAGKAILDAVVGMLKAKKDSMDIGNYGGFKLIIDDNSNKLAGDSAILTLKGKGEYQTDASPGASDVGLGLRLQNTAAETKTASYIRAEIEQRIKDFATLKQQIGNWDKASELAEVKARHSFVIEALKPKAKQEPVAEPTPTNQITRDWVTIDGTGLVTVIDEDVARLPAPEVQTLEQHYGVKRGTTEFLQKVKDDIVLFATKGAQAVDKAVREIISKLHATTLSVAIIFNPTYISTPEFIVHPSYNYTVEEQVLADVPKDASPRMSADAKQVYRVLYPSIKTQLVKHNKFMIIADKPSARIFVFRPDGSLLIDKKVLLGLTKGDFYKGNNDLPQNRITPAGLFTMGLRDATRSEGEARTAGEYDFKKVFVLDKAIEGEYSVTLFHSVWLKESDAKLRAKALKTDDQTDSRYSFGCINVDKDTYGNLVNNHLNEMDGASLFIVPDNSANLALFLSGKKTIGRDELYRTEFTPATMEVTKTIPTFDVAGENRQDSRVEADRPRRYATEQETKPEPKPKDRDTDGQDFTDIPLLNISEETREEKIREYQSLRSSLGHLPRWVSEGKISIDLQQHITQLLKRTKEIKTELEITKPRRDSAEVFLAKALTEYDEGNISKDVLDVVNAAYRKTPELLEGMKLSVRTSKSDRGVSGSFRMMDRILTLYKGTAGVETKKTIRHELTHSLEQMMTQEQHLVIIQSWLNALQRAMKKHQDKKHRDYFKAIVDFFDKPSKENYDNAVALLPSYEMYQLFNPSEYWAVNAEKLLDAQLGSAWDKFKRAVRKLWEAIKKVLGFDNRYDVHKIFNQVMGGSKERLDDRSIVQTYIDDRDAYIPLLENIDEEKELLKKYSRPNTPTTSNEILKPLVVNSAKKAKEIFKDAVKNPKGEAAKVGNVLTDALLEARNQAVFYGAGLEARDFAKYGGQLRTAQGLVTASVALDNAIRCSNIGQEVLFRGGIRYNPDSGMYEAKNTTKGMHGVYRAQKKLLDKLGKQVGTDIIQGYLEAKRSISINNEYLDREAAYQNALGAYENALKDGVDLEIVESFKMVADGLKQEVEQIKKALSSVNMSEEEMYEFSELDQKHPELREIIENYTAVNKSLLKMWKDVKLIPESRYTQLSKIKDYVPWNRIMDDGLDVHDPQQFTPQTTTRTMTNIAREKLFKRGKPTAVVDFRAKEGQQDFKINPSSVVEVEVNGVPIEESKISVTADGKVRIDEPLKENDLVVFKTHREIQNIIDNMTHNVMRMTINGLRQYAANRIVMEYASRNEKGKVMLFPKADRNKGRFAWMLNGKKVFVEIQDPLVAQAIYGMDNMNLKMFAPMAAVANLTRRTITLDPFFQGAQVFKDSATAAFVTGVKNPAALIGSVWTRFLTSLTGTEPAVDILKAAGIGGYSPSRTSEDEINRRLGVMNGNVYHMVIRALDHISDASDMAQRVAVYKRVMAETNDEMLAKYQAANVFNQMRHGASPYAQLFTRTIPFANAYAVTIDKLVQTLVGGGLKGMDRKKALARLGVCASMLAGISLLYAMAVGGDPEYEELDDQTKLKNFIIPGTKIMLPMNTSAAFFFKAIPEIVYDYITNKGTESEYDARRLRQALSGVALDALTSPTPIPTAIKPILEVSVNHNFWTSRSITPVNLKNVDAAEQYTSSTSELGKAISAALEIPGTDGKRVLNPIEADHIVRGLFGTVGAFSQWITNSIGAKAGTRPEPSAKENPLLGRFLRDEVPRGREDLYYDLKGVVDNKYQTWLKMMERGAYDEADAYLDQNANAISMNDYINDTDAELNYINDAISRLGESKDQDLSPKERRKEIDEMKRIKNEILEPVKEMRREVFK